MPGKLQIAYIRCGQDYTTSKNTHTRTHKQKQQQEKQI